MKQIALGMIMYSSDADDRFPHGSKWMDTIWPYLKNDGLYHCPEVTEGYGYAYSSAMPMKKSTRKDGDVVPLVFDSRRLDRSAVAVPTSLNDPDRHHGMTSMAFVDGHAGSKATWPPSDAVPRVQ